MFTGIIEAVGRVGAVARAGEMRRIQILVAPRFLEGLKVGDSVAIDGACMTPVEVEAGAFTVQAVGTTLSRTVAGDYAPGSQVNLERAMVLGGRLDGHLVQGHVDGLGQLVSIVEEGGFHRMVVRVPGDVHRLTLLHGSITLNGVSLTVNRLFEDDCVEVALIPHTWDHTNFRSLGVGAAINVEGDLIGKYVGKLLLGGSRGFLGLLEEAEKETAEEAEKETAEEAEKETADREPSDPDVPGGAADVH